jgi:hypothetical protein
VRWLLWLLLLAVGAVWLLLLLAVGDTRLPCLGVAELLVRPELLVSRDRGDDDGDDGVAVEDTSCVLLLVGPCRSAACCRRASSVAMSEASDGCIVVPSTLRMLPPELCCLKVGPDVPLKTLWLAKGLSIKGASRLGDFCN